jgi:hypothetical protein
MKHWMFSCKDISQKVSLSLDVQLPFHHRTAVRVHLLMCRYCARFRRQLIMLRRLSRHTDYDLHAIQALENLSPEAKERIKTNLRSRS